MNQSDSDLPALLAIDLNRYFKSLVETYQYQLYTFVLRQCGSPEEAEDILQEAFLRSYYALGNYPAQKVRELKLRSWLYKVTLNVFYSRLRKSAPASVPLDDSAESALLEIEDTGVEQPEEELERVELRRELKKLVSALPEGYRLAITLFYFEGFSYQEIADLAGLPLGTIKARIHRGLRLLRKAADEQGVR